VRRRESRLKTAPPSGRPNPTLQRPGGQWHVAALRLRQRFEGVPPPLLSARLPSLRLVPGQTLRFQPNTSFRGPLSLLVEWDT
jgi:hypothetical protein